jgi:allophanate hydrolase subunit 2
VAPPGTTIQDAGRPGWLGRGVPPSGPLDPTSHAAANLAVGNAAGAAAIEIPLAAARFVARAPLVVSLDGRAATEVAAGAVVEVPASTRAVRYLAIAGGIDVPRVLGARATLLSARLGGVHGRALRAGDRLRAGTARAGATRARTSDAIDGEARVAASSDAVALPPVGHVSDGRAGHAGHAGHASGDGDGDGDGDGERDPGNRRGDGATVLDAVLAPRAAAFPLAARDAFFSATWRVSRAGDRVGVRLEGAGVPGPSATPMPAPMVRGGVQITSAGTPIVLGPDHPTTGGYPVLAVLVLEAQAKLARLRPGAEVRFRLVSA